MNQGVLGLLGFVLLCPTVWAQAPPVPSPLAQLAAQAAANPRDANLQYRLGLAYEQAGDAAAALRAYFQAHLANPTEARTLVTMARLYARNGVYERAAYWFRKLLLLRPGDEKITREAAELALKHKQPLQAEGLLKQALKYHPDALDLWLLLGQTYETLKLYIEAVNCYEQVVDLRPPSLSDRRRLIDLYLRTSQPGKALPQIRLALRQRPRDLVLLTLLGDCHLALRNPAAAADAYEQAAQLVPHSPEYRLKLAEALVTAGDHAAALKEYERVCRLAQPNVELLLKVSSLAGKLGDAAAAQHYLELLVALLPAEAEHRRLLAQTALAQGDTATALAQYWELQRGGDTEGALREADLARSLGGREWALQRLLSVAPAVEDRPDLAAQVAVLLVGLGETTLGGNLATRVVLQPGAKPEERVLAARALVEIGELGRAESVFRQVLTRDPRHPGALLGLARLLQSRERWAESHDLLRGGFAANPRHEELALALARAADQTGNLEALSKHLRRLVETDPKNDIALRTLSNTYRSLGGTVLSAREMVALAVARPQEKLWSLEAARELGAARRWKEAAAFYESLARDPAHGATARQGLCEVLLAEEQYGELLTALGRLAEPGKLGPEGYALLTEARGQPALQKASQATNLPANARAAAALFLAPAGTESYYLALADLCLAMRCTELGVSWLLAPAPSPHRPGMIAAALLRLQRDVGRAAVALEWLERTAPRPLSPATRMEEVYCLLAANRVPEAIVKAEALLQVAPPYLRADAHYLCGEALADSYRPEEAVWHYARALIEGHDPAGVLPRLKALCLTSPFPPQTMVNLLQELWLNGQTEPALTLAEGLMARPDYEPVRSWALFHARELVR